MPDASVTQTDAMVGKVMAEMKVRRNAPKKRSHHCLCLVAIERPFFKRLSDGDAELELL